MYAATRILKDNLKIITEGEIEEEECGIRKGRSCVDTILIVKQLLERRREITLLCFLFGL